MQISQVCIGICQYQRRALAHRRARRWASLWCPLRGGNLYDASGSIQILQTRIKFDTIHADGRTIVIATVPPSDKRPVCALDEAGKTLAYIRINDENIVASPVHLALWREAQKPKGTIMTYDNTVRLLLDTMRGRQTLNQIVRRSRLPRHKVITLLARLIHFHIIQWEYSEQQFLFYLKDEFI